MKIVVYIFGTLLLVLLIGYCVVSNQLRKTTWGGWRPEEPELALPAQTHLHDTMSVSGSMILFLRPDDQRFENYADDPESGIYESDSDFGFGISTTLDSLETNKRYKGIHGEVSTRRYILIRDCAGGPLLIDRDTIDYGVILTAKGRKIETNYASVHGGNYLQEVETYFKVR